MTLTVIDVHNKPQSEVTLKLDVKEAADKSLLYYAVKALRNNLRHGTVKVKDRAEINKTNRKIYKQKGTGNARHGSRRPNIFVGGASAHGPRPRSYNEKINVQFRKSGIQEAFRYLIQMGALKVIDKLNLDKPKTKEAAKILRQIGAEKALIILPQAETNAHLAFRNLKDVKVINDNNLNVYDLLCYENVVITSPSFATVTERYGL